MINSLRGRLTLWYLGAFTLILLIFSVSVYFLVSRILYEHLDTNLRTTLRAAATAVSDYKPPASSSGPAQALDDSRFPNQLVLLLDANGRVLAKKPVTSSVPPRIPLPLHAAESPQLYQLPETTAESDDACRGFYQRVFNGSTSSYYYVAVIASEEMLSDQLDTLQNVMTGAVLLALLAAGSGGWLLAKRSLSPLAAMAAAVETITASNLTQRVPVANPKDELGRVAARFNDLLSRLDQAFAQQRQFMADASHELRTPLSAVRTAAQVALQKPQRTEPEYREAMALVEQQTARLSRIVDDLFALARADMGQLPLETTDLHLDDVIAEVVSTLKVLADRKGVKLQSNSLTQAPYRGDEDLLRRMISNLVDNAIKYTPASGNVSVSLKRVDSGYEITVTDSGRGIPSDVQPHIFERFCRSNKGRCDNDGAGLGLSIARSIARLHLGEITLAHSSPEGSTFTIVLPIPG